MSWQPKLAESARLTFIRIGFLDGGLRLFLRLDEDAFPKYLIQMNAVASFYDSLQRGTEIRISHWPEHGSFGWRLKDPHESIKISGVSVDSGMFLALAKQIEYRFANQAEALNWPG